MSGPGPGPVLVVAPDRVPSAPPPDGGLLARTAGALVVVPAWLLDATGALAPDPAADAWRGAAGQAAAAGAPPGGGELLAVRAPDARAALAALAGGGARLEEELAARVLAAPAAGVCLDLAGDLGAVRDDLGALVERLSWRLRRAERLLAVAVDAEVREPEPGEPPTPYDYRVLGVYADLLLVRGFGFGGDEPPPHATAPIGWLETVLEHALSLVPARALRLCLPLFGYLWRPDAARGVPVPLREAERLPGARRRDAATATVEVTGRDEGGPFAAWVDDVDTLAEKAALVERWGAGGLGFWGLGGEPAGLAQRLAHTGARGAAGGDA